MNREPETGGKPRLFYGWWIILAGFAAVAYGTGTQGYIAGQTLDFLMDLGSAADQAAMIMGISNMMGIIALLAIGPLIDKYGPRRLMLIGIPVAGCAILGLSIINSLPTLWILQGILLMGMYAGFSLPVQTATANWFMRKRSIALAIICAAPVLGNLVIGFLGEQSANQFGLQGAYLGLGIVMLLIGIPLALVIRHRPEQHGYLPDGRVSATETAGQLPIEKTNPPTEVNFSLRQALRTRVFWMLAVACALATGMTIATVHMPLYLVERGLDHKAYQNIDGAAPLMGLAWILLFGFLGDKFPKRYLLAIAIALGSLSAVILMAVESIAHLYLYMLVSSFSSAMTPLILAIRADYFGRKAFATITVVMGFISGIIGVGLVPLGSWMYDHTGDYQLVFLLSMFVVLIAAVIFFFAKPPEQPQQALTDPKTT